MLAPPIRESPLLMASVCESEDEGATYALGFVQGVPAAMSPKLNNIRCAG